MVGSDGVEVPMRQRTFLAAVFTIALAARSAAAFGYFESTSGDLADVGSAPNAFTLVNGANLVVATTTQGDLDYFSVTVPAGLYLNRIDLLQFDSSDDLAFLAVQSGATFTEPPTGTDVGNLLGWTHFGTSGTATLGTNILDDLGAGAGAIGFLPPLHPGTYTFWVQQTDPTPVTYRFFFVGAPIPAPEPGTWLTTALGLAFLAASRRRRTR
jgi:hypothetical protein